MPPRTTPGYGGLYGLIGSARTQKANLRLREEAVAAQQAAERMRIMQRDQDYLRADESRRAAQEFTLSRDMQNEKAMVEREKTASAEAAMRLKMQLEATKLEGLRKSEQDKKKSEWTTQRDADKARLAEKRDMARSDLQGALQAEADARKEATFEKDVERKKTLLEYAATLRATAAEKKAAYDATQAEMDSALRVVEDEKADTRKTQARQDLRTPTVKEVVEVYRTRGQVIHPGKRGEESAAIFANDINALRELINGGWYGRQNKEGQWIPAAIAPPVE